MFMYIILLLFSTIFVCCELKDVQCGETFTNSPRESSVVQLGEFPWLALLGYKKTSTSVPYFQCSGVLLDDKYVLTVASCVVGRIKGLLGELSQVRLGEYDMSTEEDCQHLVCTKYIDFDIDEIIIHDEYLVSNKYNDIALIKLDGPVKYNNYIVPICLPINQGTQSNDVLQVAGWGKDSHGVSYKVLQKSKSRIRNTEICEKLYKSYNLNLLQNHVCAGGHSYKDTCTGMAGTPLVGKIKGLEQYYVEGILRFGANPCGVIGKPNVYIKVHDYFSWISQYVFTDESSI